MTRCERTFRAAVNATTSSRPSFSNANDSTARAAFDLGYPAAVSVILQTFTQSLCARFRYCAVVRGREEFHDPFIRV